MPKCTLQNCSWFHLKSLSILMTTTSWLNLNPSETVSRHQPCVNSSHRNSHHKKLGQKKATKTSFFQRASHLRTSELAILGTILWWLLFFCWSFLWLLWSFLVVCLRVFMFDLVFGFILGFVVVMSVFSFRGAGALFRYSAVHFRYMSARLSMFQSSQHVPVPVSMLYYTTSQYISAQIDTFQSVSVQLSMSLTNTHVTGKKHTSTNRKKVTMTPQNETKKRSSKNTGTFNGHGFFR